MATEATRYALEGDAWLFADRDGWLDGDERTAGPPEALRTVEQEPCLFGITSHLLTGGRREVVVRNNDPLGGI